MKAKKNEENAMNLIAQRITSTPAGSPEVMAQRIKREAPTLADLNNEQLEQIARLVMTQRLASELNTAVDLAGVDWKRERDTFLSDAKSDHTRRAYDAALTKLENWADRKGLNLLAMTSAQADGFIRSLKEEGRAANSTRCDVAAVSAFFSYLERATDGKVKNAFRGTRIRPPNENIKEIVVPSENDVEIIMASVPAVEKAILATLALRGLRAGALPTLELKSGRYHGSSKGKRLMEGEVAGITLPHAVLDAMKAAKLNMKKPFAWTTRQGTVLNASAIESRINKHIGKLCQEGKIKIAFSCHDFRHYFATQEYKKNKDIFRLSKLLNHSGVQITQVYLRSLGIAL